METKKDKNKGTRTEYGFSLILILVLSKDQLFPVSQGYERYAERLIIICILDQISFYFMKPKHLK